MYDDGQDGPAPYELSAISMPDHAGGCSLIDALPSPESQDLREFSERLLLSSDELGARIKEEGLASVCWDPQLKHNDSSYVEFIQSLHSR
eukprot:5065556-Karenia_brevis.AAC.1